MDPPEIIVLAGEEYTTIIDDAMPSGSINARLRFNFTNNNNNYETICKIFEYVFRMGKYFRRKEKKPVLQASFEAKSFF